MKFALNILKQNTAVPLLIVCLFAFVSTVFQAVMANRLATETVQTYAPKIEKQAAALIVGTLPRNEQGNQAKHLAQALVSNVERQYAALSHAVESQASALTNQALVSGVASILALIGFFESKRKVPSAA